MTTVQQVLRELKKMSTPQTRKTLLRHGAPESTLGVKIGDMKSIVKKIKGNQQLACDLYETGVYDCMYLAGLVADGAQMTKRQLDAWAKSAPCGTICDYTVAGVAAESPHAREMAIKWIKSRKEPIACCGWSTYTHLVSTAPDDDLDLQEIEELLEKVVSDIDNAPNKVRYVMNGFVIAVGCFVKPLLKRAKLAAKSIGTVSVDMGETACQVPVATDYIKKVESMGRIGKKRKSTKC